MTIRHTSPLPLLQHYYTKSTSKLSASTLSLSTCILCKTGTNSFKFCFCKIYKVQVLCCASYCFHIIVTDVAGGISVRNVLQKYILVTGELNMSSNKKKTLIRNLLTHARCHLSEARTKK